MIKLPVQTIQTGIPALDRWCREVANTIRNINITPGSFTAGGDLSGTATSQQVISIQGIPVVATGATVGQALAYNGASYVPTGVGGSTPSVIVASPVATTGTVGTGTNYARDNHEHAHGSRPGGSEHASVTTSVNGFMSATDKVKLDGLSPYGAAPPDVATSSTAGVASGYALGDHTHGHGNQSNGSQHTIVTTSTNGFMSATDKVKIDAVYVPERLFYIDFVTRSNQTITTGALTIGSYTSGTATIPASQSAAIVNGTGLVVTKAFPGTAVVIQFTSADFPAGWTTYDLDVTYEIRMQVVHPASYSGGTVDEVGVGFTVPGATAPIIRCGRRGTASGYSFAGTPPGYTSGTFTDSANNITDDWFIARLIYNRAPCFSVPTTITGPKTRRGEPTPAAATTTQWLPGGNTLGIQIYVSGLNGQSVTIKNIEVIARRTPI